MNEPVGSADGTTQLLWMRWAAKVAATIDASPELVLVIVREQERAAGAAAERERIAAAVEEMRIESAEFAGRVILLNRVLAIIRGEQP